MQIRSIYSIPIETDEPVAAIRQFIRVLRTRVVSTDKTRVEITLSGISARATKAIEEFNPDRADGTSFEQSVAVIEELTHLPAAKLKSLMFNLSAEDFLWKGAPAGTFGKLHLADLKIFRQKGRFGLSAILDFQAPDARGKEVSALLASVNKQTGLKFSIATSSVLFEPTDQQANAEQLLVTQLAWNELTHDVGENVRARFNALALPQLMSSSASIDYNFDPAKLGKSTRVDFRKIVRRWFKEGFPDYKASRDDIDDHGIKKEVADNLYLSFHFDKRPGAFSKSFGAWLEIELTAPPFAPMPDRPYRMRIAFFELFDLFMYYWAYFSKEELDAALDGARPVIRAVLDLMEREAPEYLRGTLERKLDEFEGPRSVTAKQAFDLIDPLAKAWAPDAALNSIQLSPVVANPGTFAMRLPLHAGHGRLGQGGQWRLIFLSLTKREHLQFFVPWRGPIRRSCYPLLRGENVFSDPDLAKLQGVHVFNEGWIDSDRALELALDKLILEGASPVDVNFRMSQDWQSGSAWRLSCQLKKHGNLNITQVQVPAYGDGSVGSSVTRFDKNGTALDGS